MANAGDVTAHLKLDDSRFKAGVNNAGKWSRDRFSQIGGVAAAAFSGAFAVEQVTSIIEKAAGFKTFALQAGITTEEFQRLNTAIEIANGDASDTVSIILDLKRAMADARTGNKQWIADFESLGITMDQIKKDDPVSLFMAIGKSVANSAELTGEQVNALGRMMGEDTSARAIAAFRNNFETTLRSVNVLTDSTIEKLRQVNSELRKASMEADKSLAEQLANQGEGIATGARIFGQFKNNLIAGGGAVLGFVNDQLLEPMVKNYLEPAINAGYELKYGNMNNFPVRDASPDWQRREEIQGMIKDQTATLKKIEQNTSTNGVSSAIMGG